MVHAMEVRVRLGDKVVHADKYISGNAPTCSGLDSCYARAGDCVLPLAQAYVTSPAVAGLQAAQSAARVDDSEALLQQLGEKIRESADDIDRQEWRKKLLSNGEAWAERLKAGGLELAKKNENEAEEARTKTAAERKEKVALVRSVTTDLDDDMAAALLEKAEWDVERACNMGLDEAATGGRPPASGSPKVAVGASTGATPRVVRARILGPTPTAGGAAGVGSDSTPKARLIQLGPTPVAAPVDIHLKVEIPPNNTHITIRLKETDKGFDLIQAVAKAYPPSAQGTMTMVAKDFLTGVETTIGMADFDTMLRDKGWKNGDKLFAKLSV